MIVNVTFSDIARTLRAINRDSWQVKVIVKVTSKHIICVDEDNEVEFFRCYHENTRGFFTKLHLLNQAMLNYDYEDIDIIRPRRTQKFSYKMFKLWKKANEIKLLKLLSMPS